MGQPSNLDGYPSHVLIVDNLALSLSAGANDFVRKPYQPIELLARLDAAVSHKRLTDQLDSAESMLFALARMVEAKDGNTGDHCSRLSHSGVVLGQAMGLGPDELMALRGEDIPLLARVFQVVDMSLFSEIRSTGALDWDDRPTP